MMIRLFAGAVAPGAMLFAATLAAAAPANPQTDQAYVDVRQIHVSYADLDLSQPAAQREMARRISHAVGEVCGNDVRGIDWADALRCRSSARADANVQMTRVMAAYKPVEHLALNGE